MTEERPDKHRDRRTAKKWDRAFFIVLAVLISSTAFAGFAFTYFGPILGGSYPPTGAALHVHGWSFFLWFLLFPLQVVFARKRRRLHMSLGRLSVMLVAMMALTGILVLTVRVEEAVRTGKPQVWLLYGPLILSNLTLFVVFYAAGIRMAMKNQLEAHKRLILVASAIGLGAGFFRLILFLSGFHPLSLPVGVIGCSVFIGIGIAYDWFTRRYVHPVYWIGLLALLAAEVPLLPQVSPDLVASINQGLATIGEQLSVFYHPEPTVEF